MVGLYSVQPISANFMSEETAEKQTQLSIKRLENGSGELQVGRPRWESNTVRELKKGRALGLLWFFRLSSRDSAGFW